MVGNGFVAHRSEGETSATIAQDPWRAQRAYDLVVVVVVVIIIIIITTITTAREKGRRRINCARGGA